MYAKVRRWRSIFNRFPVFRNKTVHFVLVDTVSWDKHGQKTSHETNDERKFGIGEWLTNETI